MQPPDDAAAVAVLPSSGTTADSDGATPEPAPRQAASLAATRSSASAPSVLELAVLRDDGEPAAGTVSWISTPEPPSRAARLAPENGQSLPAGVGGQRYERRTSIDVPPGHWTWLRATAERTPAMSGYLLVPPFSGRHSEQITLGSETRTLHVFLLRDDWSGPAPRQRVTLFHRDLRAGDFARQIAAASTDEAGYAVFRGLPGGVLLACAPGSPPEGASPHTARFVLPPGLPSWESPCVIVMPPPTRRVRFAVQAELDGGGCPPVLLLCGLGQRDQEVHPFPVTLRSGQQVVEAKVPPGAYELWALPLGSVQLLPPDRIYQVGAAVDGAGQEEGEGEDGEDQVFRLAVVSNQARTTVVLEGLGPNDLPVTVLPRPVDRPIPGDLGLWFCGPHRWRRTEMVVRVPGYPCRLIARGRPRHWISDSVVELTGERVEVSMRPATRLEVQWFVDELAAHRDIAVEVAVGDQVDILLLRPKLVAMNGEIVTALTGSLVVPRGEVELRCGSRDGGRHDWSRTLLADRPRMTATVRGVSSSVR